MQGSDAERDPPPATGTSRRAWAILVVLLAVTAWSFRGNLELGFTDADALADVAAARVEHTGDLLHQVTQPLAAGVAGENANFWRPVTMLHYALLRALFGWDPLGYQVWDLGLHLCVVAVAFLWMRAARRPEGEALLVAGILALHPLGVEVVPAVARSIDLIFPLFGLIALLAITKGRVGIAAVAGVLAIGAKETAVVILPIGVLWAFFLGRRRDAGILAVVWGVALLLYLWGRSAVLAGWGGYRGEEATFFLGKLGWSLGSGSLELLLPGWTPQIEAWLSPAWAVPVAILALASAFALSAVAWRRGNRVPAVGFALAFAPIVLYGLTGLYSRRLVYLPVAGLAVAIGSLWQLRSLRWAIGAWIVSLAPASPLFHRDRDWLANDAVTRAMTDRAPDLAALPPGAVLWVLDRPIRIDNDPRRRMLWRDGWSVNNTATTYSLDAWVDEGLGRRDIDVRFLGSLSSVRELDQADVSVEAGWIHVRRAPFARRWGGPAHESWEIEERGSDLALRRTGTPSNEWLLVLGVPRASLVEVP